MNTFILPRCVKNKAHMTFDNSVLENPSHWIDGCVYYLCRIRLPSYLFLKSLNDKNGVVFHSSKAFQGFQKLIRSHVAW